MARRFDCGRRKRTMEPGKGLEEAIETVRREREKSQLTPDEVL